MTTDQLRLPAPRIQAQLREAGPTAVLVGALVAAAVLGAVVVTHPELWHLLLAAGLTINLIMIAMKWPRAAAVATLLWLPFIGLVRRLLMGETGWVTNDPLLLVGPIVALFLLYRLFVLEKRRLAPNLISKLVLALLVIAFFGAFNPVGTGGVRGGLAGLIYLGVPLLWFFVGRDLADRRMMTGLTYAVIAVAVAIGCYGLYQTEFGSMPQWDIDWYETTGYPGVRTGESETDAVQFRPWGTFPSTTEYSYYLGIALVLAIAMFYHRRLVVVAAMPLLAAAIFLAGGRSSVVLIGLAAIVMGAFRTRNRVLALIVVVAGIGLVYGIALAFGPAIDRAANTSGSANTQRQVGALLNPLDPEKSTFLTHWDYLWIGVREGFSNPAGNGTGASNLGATVGDSSATPTDTDLSDVFVSLGALGGLTFAAIIILAFYTVFSRYLKGRPDRLLLATGGVLVVTFGQWLNGGHYAASALTWLYLGFAMRPMRTRAGSRAGPPESAVERLRRWAPWWRGRDAEAARESSHRRERGGSRRRRHSSRSGRHRSRSR